MAEPARFEVDGVHFELSPLPVDDACCGMDLLNSAEGAAKMAKLARLFAAVCKVSRTKTGEFAVDGQMVAMKPFFEDLFRSRLDLLVEFVGKAVQAEYGGFLAKHGVEAPEFARPTTPTP